MSLLGSAARTRTVENGTFWCPRERGNRRFRMRSVRRWARIGPVPVVPLDELGRFVECASCEATFGVDLLGSGEHRAEEDMVTRALRRAVGLVLVVGDAPTPEERREAVIMLQRYANVPYSSRDLDTDMAAAADPSLNLDLRPLAAGLNDRGRNAVIDATVHLATRRHRIDPAQLDAVRSIARALELPSDQVRDAIQRRVDRAVLTS